LGTEDQPKRNETKRTETIVALQPTLSPAPVPTAPATTTLFFNPNLSPNPKSHLFLLLEDPCPCPSWCSSSSCSSCGFPPTRKDQWWMWPRVRKR